MKFDIITKNNCTIGIVDDVLTNREIEEVWKELDFLSVQRKMMSAEFTGSAQTTDKSLKKQNWGVALSKCFTDPIYSNFAQYHEKPLTDDFVEDLIEANLYFRLLRDCNYKSILLSYYEHENYYHSHHDVCCLTTLFWFNKSPKQFKGGDIYFKDMDQTVSFKNNRFIIFPSIYFHEVSKVSMDNNFRDNGISQKGRYCYTTFYKH